MNKKTNKTFIFLIIGVIIVVLAAILLLFIGINNYNNRKNPETETEKVTLDLESVRSFLTSGNYLSTSSVLGSSPIPSGCVFLESGSFACVNRDFYRRFTDTEEHRLISYIGTWSFDNDKLIMTVTQEERAYGGTIVENENVGNSLTEYERGITEGNKTEEYTIKGMEKEDGYRDYLLLIDENGSQVKWYSLGNEKDLTSLANHIAQYGYDGEYYNNWKEELWKKG